MFLVASLSEGSGSVNKSRDVKAGETKDFIVY